MTKRRPILLFLLGPGAVFILLFTALPLYLMVQKGFYKSNYIAEQFVGLRNYIQSFRDESYRAVWGTSFLYSAIICPAVTILPLLVALVIYDLPKWFRNYTKFMFFAPSFAAGVIISQVWKWIFQPRLGILNHLLGLIGIEGPMWMGERFTAIGGISLMTIMGGLGFPLLIYLSAILSINKELFDTARVDGANEWQIKTKILLPFLLPTVLLIVLLTMGTGFYFVATILEMTGGGHGTANFLYDIFSQAYYKRQMGMASARSTIVFVLVLGMVIAKRRIERCLIA